MKSNGIGLSGFIFLIFLFLKLAQIGVVANWSWWWVTSPLWMPISLVACFWIVFVIIYAILKIVKES
jgi:hypothetical protein